MFFRYSLRLLNVLLGLLFVLLLLVRMFSLMVFFQLLQWLSPGGGRQGPRTGEDDLGERFSELYGQTGV